jgi:hypothetical protein
MLGFMFIMYGIHWLMAIRVLIFSINFAIIFPMCYLLIQFVNPFWFLSQKPA